MKCLLHIGTEKTATTLLQGWLYDNQERLGKDGIYLSDNLGSPNNRLICAYFASDLDWQRHHRIANKAEKDQFFSGFLEKLREEIATVEKTHSVFVITSEHFHSRLVRADEIQMLYTYLASVFTDVEVVCYFREQFDLAVSRYSTRLRNDCTVDVETFVGQATPDDYYYNYFEIANNWADVFGIDNCNFRIYDRSKFIDGDIRLDFLSLIGVGIDAAYLNMDRFSANEALSPLQSAAFKAINKNIPFWNSDRLGQNKTHRQLKAELLNIESLRLGEITSGKRELIRSRFRETNSLFFDKYFTGMVQFPAGTEKEPFNIENSDAMAVVSDVVDFFLQYKGNKGQEKRNKGYVLNGQEIDSLRDIALRLHASNSALREDALSLMKIALKSRPMGNLIKKKVERWSSELGSLEDE